MYCSPFISFPQNCHSTCENQLFEAMSTERGGAFPRRGKELTDSLRNSSPLLLTTNIRSDYGSCICHVNRHTQSKASCPPSHDNDSEPPSLHLRLAPPCSTNGSTSEDVKTQPNHAKTSLSRAKIRYTFWRPSWTFPLLAHSSLSHWQSGFFPGPGLLTINSCL